MLRKDDSVLSFEAQPDSGEMGMLRKAIFVLSLEPQPDSGEMGMLRKSIFVLPLEPQPDSGEVGMLRKAIFVLPLEPQPDSAASEPSEAPKARKEFLKIDVGIESARTNLGKSVFLIVCIYTRT